MIRTLIRQGQGDGIQWSTSGTSTTAQVPARVNTVCPGSSDPPEKNINIFASEEEVYTIS